MSGSKFHPNIFVVTEGHTERIFIRHLCQRNCGYSLHVEKSPQEKAIKAVRYCANEFKKRFSEKDGDIAFCVVDVDNNSEEDLIAALNYAESKGITLIISNPCFESFFLLHFKDNLPKMTPKEAKEELRKYIKGYNETTDYWDLLKGRQDLALRRSRVYGFDKAVFSLSTLKNGSNIYELFDTAERLRMDNDSKQGTH